MKFNELKESNLDMKTAILQLILVDSDASLPFYHCCETTKSLYDGWISHSVHQCDQSIESGTIICQATFFDKGLAYPIELSMSDDHTFEELMQIIGCKIADN